MITSWSTNWLIVFSVPYLPPVFISKHAIYMTLKSFNINCHCIDCKCICWGNHRVLASTKLSRKYLYHWQRRRRVIRRALYIKVQIINCEVNHNCFLLVNHLVIGFMYTVHVNGKRCNSAGYVCLHSSLYFVEQITNIYLFVILY